MQPSRRIRSIVSGASDGWGVHYRARAMEAAGRAVTFLTVGDHDVLATPGIVETMVAAARGGALGYAPSPGTPALRAAVAARLAALTGAPTGPENVVVTTGGQAALFAAMIATLDPGDACVLVEPWYATFPMTVRAAAGRVVTVAARPERGFAPDPAEIDAAIAGSGARALLINSPNNPTGAVYPRAVMEGIAEVCRARDVWLVSDEVYDALSFDAPHLSPRALPGMAERTLVVGSLSKSHAMTGFRIGWVAGPAETCARVADLAIAATYGAPGFIQAAALHALTAEPGGEAVIAARYRRRRDAALAVFEGGNVVGVHRPAGAMYLMLDVRDACPSGETFAERLLEEEGVAVMPGESFGAAAAGHVRVALTIPDEALLAALGRLRAFAERLSVPA